MMFFTKYCVILCLIFIVVTGTLSFPSESQNFELLILHNNDIHARFEETSRRSSACSDAEKEKNECYGGLARTAHLIRKAREAAVNGTGPNVIYLNAGDTYTGTQWFSVHKSKIVTEFLNILMPDVMSFGNHEFDLGVKGLIPFINAAKFPIVAANLDFSNEPALQSTNVTKSVILDIAGTKVGVIGYLLPETARSSSAQTVIFYDEVKSVREESEKLNKQGVKIIIALGHSGIKIDIQIAKEVPLVDVVVGGHTNTFLWNGKQPDLEKPYGSYPLVVEQTSGKKVYVVQAYAFTKYLGHLNVKFNQDGDVVSCEGQPLLVDYKVPQDTDVLQVLEKYRPEVKKSNEEVVGETRVDLNGGDAHCRYKECNFGNLIADAYVEYYVSTYGGEYWTEVPIGVVNAGSIRTSLEHNNFIITRGSIMNAIPYINSVSVITLTGADLLKTLEVGVRYNGDSSRGEFLQTSGLLVVYNLTNPVGSRVVSAKARCGKCKVPIYEPIEPKNFYRVITSSFVAAGGDGHTVFRDNGHNMITLDISELDVIVWYIKKFSPVHPEVNQRSIFLRSEKFNDTRTKDDTTQGSGAKGSMPLVRFIILFTASLTIFYN